MEELGRIQYTHFVDDPTFGAFCEVVGALNAMHSYIVADESSIRPQLERLFCDIHNGFVSFSNRVM